MNLRRLILAGVLLGGITVAAERAPAQAWSTGSLRYYTLLDGSLLTDECPVCDRLPIVVPMTGTFGLHLLDQGPLSIRYGLSGISFRAGGTPWLQYEVSGDGTYEVGGEVAVTQDLFLDVVINNSLTNTAALCVNADRLVQQPWPEIRINVDQTNGTLTQLYHLNLVAVPALQLQSVLADPKTGDLRLGWEGNTGNVQVERATNVAGPYFPLAPAAAGSSLTDPGAVTNSPCYFYRLRQK